MWVGDWVEFNVVICEFDLFFKVIDVDLFGVMCYKCGVYGYWLRNCFENGIGDGDLFGV